VEPLSSWTPMRWPSGPLEAGIRQKKDRFSTELKETLERWHMPAALSFLKGSPVNCLVVSWAAGLPEDAAQQKSLGPLMEAGRREGLKFAGLITGTADKRAAMQAARSAGLQAVVAEGETPKGDLPVIPLAEVASAPWRSSPTLLALAGSRWPGVRGQADPRESNDINAAATHLAWIDSNIYLMQLARAHAPRTPVWLMFEAPDDTILTPEAYLRAVADTGAAGAQWAVSLGTKLRSGLADGSADALQTWKRIADALAFFAKHPEWAFFRSKAVLGVVSDFAVNNQMLGEETLVLFARRNLPFRVILRSAAATADLTGLKAILCLDQEPPDGAARQRLASFVKQGGLLLASEKWGQEGAPAPGVNSPRFDVRTLGKGRLAVLKESSPDPYLVARDAHFLLDRVNDLLRFYNISTTICRFISAGGGKPDVLQFVNFARRDPADGIPLWLHDSYRTARLWSLGESAAATVKLSPELGGVTAQLPSVPIYGALELS
jgi:hypothetical protein